MHSNDESDRMNDAYDAENLLRADDPGQWPKEAVWHAFRSILDKDSPLPGMSSILVPYENLFYAIYDKIRHEHKKVFWRYYRSADGVPLVNPLNLEHLTRLLHPFMRRLHVAGAPDALVDSLFHIMRKDCNLNLFYRTEEIDQFFPLHALGSVIGYAEFGPFIAITQQCTIGHNNGRYPTIDGGLWMGPNSSILGQCKIGKNVKFAANSMVVDQDVPADTIVFGVGKDAYFKPNPADNRAALLDDLT